MYKVSVTQLTSFASFNFLQEGSALQAIQMLTTPIAPTREMLVGSIIHQVIQSCTAPTQSIYIKDFDFELTLNLLNNVYTRAWEHLEMLGANCEHPPVWEMPIQKIYIVKGNPILVTGRVDGYFKEIIEIKVTQNFSFDKFYDSMQWKIYLDILKLPRLYYLIIELPSEGVFVQDFPHVYSFSFPRYNQMDIQVQHLLEDFLDFVLYYNLESFFLYQHK